MMSRFKPLTDKDLERIFEKFVKGKHRIRCDEYHRHGFDCVDFDDETTMIIERLRVQVIMLKTKLSEISDIAKDK